MGSLVSRSVFRRLNTAVLTPIPSASDSTAASVKRGLPPHHPCGEAQVLRQVVGEGETPTVTALLLAQFQSLNGSQGGAKRASWESMPRAALCSI
jgi:hypothetical protein